MFLRAADFARAHSPYLAQLLTRFPDMPEQMEREGADAILAECLQFSGELMPALRLAKGRVALLSALADLSGAWTLEQVTGALSGLAERAAQAAVDHLLAEAEKRGEITVPAPGSGVIVLAMGKLGARELNYSSDIDLMLFFERDKLSYRGRHSEQHFMNALAHGLVYLLQERTESGYVFRTDLRLRPDPASTPPAISTDAAYYYYESVGQNWERAAMIKARPIAGDLAAGERFLANLSPFMWRRNLDFAAINDIHSIKRQMDARLSRDIRLPGFNVKLGPGGIREIEFFAQIHQLIWGGRMPALRLRGTCEALEKLAAVKLISPDTAATLKDAYVYLRTLEHRLQMENDEQTHTLPEGADGIARIAAFMGGGDFERSLLTRLAAVHDIYLASFKNAESLGGEGSLVFTGVTHDPATLETLASMGYANPETVSETVMRWHHGAYRATRTKRARELLTELMPVLLNRLARTAGPDAAFLKFDEFLSKLPVGVQPFALFNANPALLDLVADILGSAPALAEHLSKSPSLLDAALYADFYADLPDAAALAAQWRDIAGVLRDFEERLRALRRFRNEKQFQIGVHFLKRRIASVEAGRRLSDLADVMIGEALLAVTREFEQAHGRVEGGAFAVIGLGRLGSREMTFGSDVDLVFVYDAPNASVYYNRLAQRFVTALSALDREGKLYEVDTRLRPSGGQGLLAVSMEGLEKYFAESAWTFEFMAFTKARVVAGDVPGLEAFILQQLRKPRDEAKLKADAKDMRARIDKAHGTENPWRLKHVHGGLIDIEFIAQYLRLKYPEGASPGSSAEIFTALASQGRMDRKIAQELKEAAQFLNHLFHLLRLCSDGSLDEEAALPGLKQLLCGAVGVADFAALKSRLIDVERRVYALYSEMLAT